VVESEFNSEKLPVLWGTTTDYIVGNRHAVVYMKDTTWRGDFKSRKCTDLLHNGEGYILVGEDYE
jgi:hypothetical protein